MDERNRATMEASGVVVLLEARPDTIIRRLRQQQVEQGEDLVARPMLDSDDLRRRVRSLKADRQFNYTLAHWTVHTDLLTPAEAAAEVVRGLDTVTDHRTHASDSPDPDLAAEVRTSSGSYPLWVGWDIIEELGARVRGVLDTRVAYVISDIGAQPQARRAQVSMERAGYRRTCSLFPPESRARRLRRHSASTPGWPDSRPNAGT